MYKNVESLQVITACNRHANVITAAWLWHLHCGVPSLWKGVLYFPSEALVRRWFVAFMGALGSWDVVSLESL